MKETVTINFQLPNGEIKSIEANEGETILQVANFHDLPIESACGGSLACATCHVIVDEKSFKDMEITEAENDMLDLAFGLEATSRLSCQIKITKKMDGITIKIPADTNNFCGCQ